MRRAGGKPDKLIILFRHFVRAVLIPALAPVLDTQAGFKAFDAAALAPVLPGMTSFTETFDIELLIHLAQRYGPGTLAFSVMVFGPLTGGSFNPARAFGPALVGKEFDGAGKFLVVYVAAALVGALLAAFTYRAIVLEPQERDPGVRPIDKLE